ncbi:S-adenosylmethionine carrier 1, chloroplastic/mitochondrial isoform X1 [Arachis hypogaea]|uniref:S-adenosylmethionine carrier 1, chloroplastic/mitochondrial isoform X1 n=1 Tax=Arachis hypogaea TaxID=3818 RepID=UPI000DEC54A7
MSYMAAARRNLNDPENAIIGAFAGALTGAITTPLDVIKTRLMVQGYANQYNGIVDCVQTIIKEEGPSALLKPCLWCELRFCSLLTMQHIFWILCIICIMVLHSRSFIGKLG